MTRLFAPLLFASCLLFPLRTSAQRPVTIAGNVYFENDGSPAKNVLVNLSNAENSQLASESTRDNGEFRFGGLRQATYTLRINVDGYEPFSLIVDVSFNSDKILSIYLKPISKTRDSPHSSSVSVHELSMPLKARELVDSGRKKLYQGKDAKAALPDFRQAISVAPAYYEAHYHLAMADFVLGNQAEAEKEFRKAIELSADKFPEADVGLGTAILSRGDLAEADKFIRRGLQLNPNLWLAHYELGRTLLAQKRLHEALDSAEQARLLAPSVPLVYRLLSNIHLLQQDFPALLDDLNTYVALDPDSPAGLRAQQLREQVQQKIAAQHTPPPSPTHP